MEKKLTEAFIQKHDDSLDLQIDLNSLTERFGYPYLLVIKSKTRKYLKITIYPVEKKTIIKILIITKENDEKQFSRVLKHLKSYDVIHTSGLIMLESQIFYECYLNMNWETKNYKDLKKLITKQGKKFLKLKFEKIELESG